MFNKKSCFKKFRNIRRKTPVLESVFNKITFSVHDQNAHDIKMSFLKGNVTCVNVVLNIK